MIKTTIFIKEHQFFTILKLPFVKSIELNHMSKQSKTEHCAYRAGVILKDQDNFYQNLKGTITPELLLTIDNKRVVQQICDTLIEIEKTGKLKSKNFKRLCAYSEIYKFQIHNKKKYLQQIEILKALSINV